MNLYGLDVEQLEALIEPRGARPFHARQIYRWLYGRGVLDPAEWTDLSKPLRAELARDFTVEIGVCDERAVARDGTIKYRVALAGGGHVETVYMRYDDRVTLCLSSQVGCALDCDFCLTGKMGFVRHLDAGEIVGQVQLVKHDRGLDEPFNVVFMGMGEPLHNYDGVVRAVRMLTDAEGFALSRKRVTVSTSGLAPAIEKLAAEPVRPRFALSLNATTDESRARIMPITRKYPISRLLEACRHWAERTRERFTFEYVLLDDYNDSDADIQRLARLTRGLPVKVNLIPFNAVAGWLPYRAPTRERVEAFRDGLLARQVPTSVRWSRGAEARAACGQLALLPER